MNPFPYVHKFFIFSGALLVVIAVLQTLMRRREKGARPFDAATLRVLLFLTVGVLAILAGAGVLPLPGDR